MSKYDVRNTIVSNTTQENVVYLLDSAAIDVARYVYRNADCKENHAYRVGYNRHCDRYVSVANSYANATDTYKIFVGRKLVCTVSFGVYDFTCTLHDLSRDAWAYAYAFYLMYADDMDFKLS